MALRGSPLAALLALLFLGGCSAAVMGPSAPSVSTPAPGPSTTGPVVAPGVGSVETGLASWYGNPYHGRRAASGEVYDMNDLTAAHPTLPFGARVLVTHARTGEAVEVRINDRGPFGKDRIIDLSHAAARILGGVGPGVIPVRVQVVALPGRPGLPASPPRFAVQVGAYTSRERAEALRQALSREGTEAVIATTGAGSETYHRVQIGSFPDRQSAQQAAGRLAERGYQAVIVDR